MLYTVLTKKVDLSIFYTHFTYGKKAAKQYNYKVQIVEINIAFSHQKFSE